MFFADTQLPDDLLIALEENRLVIFAGAGISMAPPSSLPSFPKLALELCEDGVEFGDEDQRLGKRKDQGADVHSAVARKMIHDNTHPTKLHFELLRLFRDPKKVRIVTTNFDDHFSMAARKLYGSKVSEFCAPAIPLGHDFEGIVYLHGSAGKPHGMVLTDKDFGRAYLTQGWAREFLVSLFSEFSVLFVGYSHNDIIVSSLAKGMNPESVRTRWALIPSDLKPKMRENWQRLGIEVLDYPIDNGHENKHHSLTDCFIAWSKHAKESILHRSKKVRVIARRLPSELAKDSQYLDFLLSQPRLLGDFCKAIKHPSWIGWMAKRGYFDGLFLDKAKHDTVPSFQPSPQVLAIWLTDFVRRKFPQLLMLQIEEHDQRLAPVFTQSLAFALVRENRGRPDPLFATWVSILLSQKDHAAIQSSWTWLLRKCQLPLHTGAALSIFALLTQPQLRIRKSFDFIADDENKGNSRLKASNRKTDVEVIWPEAAEYGLKEAWVEVLQPRLNDISEPLIAIVTTQLSLAHHLLKSLRKADSQYDQLSYLRSSIGPHEQNSDAHRVCLTVLVDAARDILDQWLVNNPSRATAQIQVWWSSQVPLLRRLAVYGVNKDSHLNEDARISWILMNDIVFGSGMKKEVFDILQVAYPVASTSVRRKLLKRIALGPLGPKWKKLDSRTSRFLKNGWF